MPTVEQDLYVYGSLASWSPKIGDVIHKDGIFNRWIAVVCLFKDDTLLVRKSGNPRLLACGDYKEDKLNFRQIINSSVGSYYVVSGSTYYV